MPRVARAIVEKVLETAEQENAKHGERRMRSTGKPEIEPSLVETVDRPVNKEWAEMMAFNAMPITIVINDSPEKNAENPVFLANNGDHPRHYPGKDVSPWLYRGKEYTIERRFVENLLRAKIVTYTQKREVDPQGVEHVINVPHAALRYDFRVVHDPHPRGGDWLKNLMLEPA